MSDIIPIYMWRVYRFFRGTEETYYCGIEPSLEEAELMAKLYKNYAAQSFIYSEIKTIKYPGAVDISYKSLWNTKDKDLFSKFSNEYYALCPKGDKELAKFLKVTKVIHKKEQVCLQSLLEYLNESSLSDRE